MSSIEAHSDIYINACGHFFIQLIISNQQFQFKPKVSTFSNLRDYLFIEERKKEKLKTFPFLFFSCPLCAAVDGPVLHKKSPLYCDGNGLLGFLGGGGSVWESPCCEHVDQVCWFFIACGHLSHSLFNSIKPFPAGMILQRCCVRYSGRTATLTCWSTFLVLSLSVSSSPSCSSYSAHCWVPLATTQSTGNQPTQHNPFTLAFDLKKTKQVLTGIKRSKTDIDPCQAMHFNMECE